MECKRPPMIKKYKVGDLVKVPRLFELLNNYTGMVYTSERDRAYVGVVTKVLNYEEFQLRYDYVVYVNGAEVVFFENELENFEGKNGRT